MPAAITVAHGVETPKQLSTPIKTLSLKASNAMLNKWDYAAADRLWSNGSIRHRAH
jgi:hypothetical protein